MRGSLFFILSININRLRFGIDIDRVATLAQLNIDMGTE